MVSSASISGRNSTLAFSCCSKLAVSLSMTMQLQYSRAFGGKDLKIFGLSSNPDVKVYKRSKEVK